MTKISSGAKKSGPPAHANKFAFVHNRNSKLTKQILALPINGLCAPCREVVEWRKRFRKYKPLTVPKKCVRCSQKTIKEAYHVVCKQCAAKDHICCKCLQSCAETFQTNQAVEAENDEDDDQDDPDTDGNHDSEDDPDTDQSNTIE